MKARELKKWMQENDVTAVDIASFLKINPTTIERYLAGKTNPRRSTLNGYARFIEWFLSQQLTSSRRQQNVATGS
jgi:transcriptional regulator with XRE-family HTH domain